MRNSKHGLKALVLAMMAAALGMMAFAGGAQAKVGFLHGKSHEHELALNPAPLSPPTNNAGTFLINLVPALLAALTVTQVGTGNLLVPKRDLDLRCTSLHLEEGKIASTTDASGKATFLGCLSFSISGGGVHLPCEIKTTLTTVTASALVLPILHNGESFALFEPQVAGGQFTSVLYKGGTECPLPLHNPVTGSISALVDGSEAVQRLILFSPGIQLLTGDELKFGGLPAYIDAHATVSLLPPHDGDKLGIH